MVSTPRIYAVYRVRHIEGAKKDQKNDYKTKQYYRKPNRRPVTFPKFKMKGGDKVDKKGHSTT